MKKKYLFGGIIFLVIVAIAVIVVVFVKHPFRGSQVASSGLGNGNATSTITVPSGPQTYGVMQAPGTLPVISRVTIDPVVVSYGGVQKFLVITQNNPNDPVVSVETKTVTDHRTVLNLLSPTTTTSTVPGAQAFAGQWTVQDTHDAQYATTFIAKDTEGHQNSVTLNWKDPTCDPHEDEGGGTYVFSTACGLSLSTDAIEEGNIQVNTQLTIGPNTSLAFSPGYQINIGAGGSILIGSGGSITKTLSTGALLPVAPPPMSISFYGSGADFMVYPQAPTNEDFKVQLCMNNTGGGTACETSPWASQEIAGTGQWVDTSSGDGTYYVTPGTSALGTGGWSGWLWDGSRDQLSANDATLSIVATTTLPAGYALNNLQLAIELAEINNAYGQGLIGSNTNLTNETLGCKISYTPVTGGSGTEVYSYTYEDSCPGTGSAGNTPDIFRMSMTGNLVTLASLRNATLSASNIPTSITHGSVVSGATITVTNNGPMVFPSNSLKFTASGPGTGNCDIDTDGDGYLDAPNPANYPWGGVYNVPTRAQCNSTGTYMAQDITLSHVGQFSETSPIPYGFTGVVRTNLFTSAFTVAIGTGCAMINTKNPFAWLFSIVRASTIGGCTYRNYPARSWTTYNIATPSVAVNGQATFTLPPMTAPSTPGTYTEKWILTDGNSKSFGKITGSTYTQTITVN